MSVRPKINACLAVGYDVPIPFIIRTSICDGSVQKIAFVEPEMYNYMHVVCEIE